MSEEAEDNTKPKRKPLTLRKTETGAVKQSFSHGRSKTVVVETKKRRTLAPKKVLKADGAGDKAAQAKAVADKAPAKEEAPKKQGAVLRTLSEDEKKARAAVLVQAKKEQEEKAKREAAERAAREKREAEEKARLEEERARQAEEDARRAKEAEARQKAEEEARKALEADETERKRRAAEKAAGKQQKPKEDAVDFAKDKDNPLAQLGGRLKTKKNFGDDRGGQNKAAKDTRRRTGKLTIANALDDEERQRSLASVKRAREREKKARQARGGGDTRISREVVIPETITVTELAQRMAMRAVDLVKELMKQGQMVTANAVLDADTAELIVEDLGHTVKRVSEADVEEGLEGGTDKEEDLKSRPPVVTIMGHVDHGKTSLLDAMRETDVVAGEAGGITQHIGAYQITDKAGAKITFLDTPGHAAFTQMRARGAEVTDIVIIVVAADDSVMPQTEEAISHAKAAEVPIIVAVNKIDKPDADANKVRTDLLQHELQVESMGGEIQDVEVSALAKTNLEGLQEAINLQAELLELKANPDREASGAVVEAQLDKGRGPVATLLVQNGTLRRGDIFVCGAEWGKVRALNNDKGQQIKEAGPAMPVEVLGLNGVPEPGDPFVVVESEARAREVADFRQRQRREKAVAGSSGTSLEQMMAQLQDAEIKELPVVLKGDVQGVCGSDRRLS